MNCNIWLFDYSDFASSRMERYITLELWAVVALFALIYLLYKCSSYYKILRLGFTIPGPPAIPFLGNVLMLTEHDVFRRHGTTMYQDYGPVVRLWCLLYPLFMVLEPHDLQNVLASNKHVNKMFFYKMLHNFLGNGLITSSGEQWKYHRKLLQSSFHLTILEKFVTTFSDGSTKLIERLTHAPRTLNITQYVNDCILDILNEAVLGIPVKNKDFYGKSPYRQGKVVAPYRVIHPWLLVDFIYKLTKTANDELNQKKNLDKFTQKMIDTRREMIQNGIKPERPCLLDFMIETSNSHPDFTDDDIMNEAMTFMLAGQDSVGAGVAFCLFLLAQNPQDQSKCYTEIMNIFKDDTRSPTIQDLREMRYLEQCIKETLRLYPSVPLFARKITENIPVGKHILPRSTEVFISPYCTHRLPHIYPEPEKFDPTRFTPENCEKRHPYAYIPFSAGPRNCIGHKFAILEMKTVVSGILRKFLLLPVSGKTEIVSLFRVTLRSKGGIWVTLKERTLET